MSDEESLLTVAVGCDLWGEKVNIPLQLHMHDSLESVVDTIECAMYAYSLLTRPRLLKNSARVHLCDVPTFVSDALMILTETNPRSPVRRIQSHLQRLSRPASSAHVAMPSGSLSHRNRHSSSSSLLLSTTSSRQWGTNGRHIPEGEWSEVTTVEAVIDGAQLYVFQPEGTTTADAVKPIPLPASTIHRLGIHAFATRRDAALACFLLLLRLQLRGTSTTAGIHSGLVAALTRRHSCVVGTAAPPAYDAPDPNTTNPLDPAGCTTNPLLVEGSPVLSQAEIAAALGCAHAPSTRTGAPIVSPWYLDDISVISSEKETIRKCADPSCGKRRRFGAEASFGGASSGGGSPTSGDGRRAPSSMSASGSPPRRTASAPHITALDQWFEACLDTPALLSHCTRALFACDPPSAGPDDLPNSSTSAAVSPKKPPVDAERQRMIACRLSVGLASVETANDKHFVGHPRLPL